MYIRYIFTDFTFFYEDYITKPEGIIFENFFTNHKINFYNMEPKRASKKSFCVQYNELKVRVVGPRVCSNMTSRGMN